MLQLIQDSTSDSLTREDRRAMLRALEDMLSLGGVILDDQGNSYSSDRPSECHPHRSQTLIYAEFKPLHPGQVMVTLRCLQQEKTAHHEQVCNALFILAQCDEDEWEVVGQPLPLSAANY